MTLAADPDWEVALSDDCWQQNNGHICNSIALFRYSYRYLGLMYKVTQYMTG